MKRFLLAAVLLAVPASRPAVAAPAVVSIDGLNALTTEMQKAESAVRDLERRLRDASTETARLAARIDRLKQEAQSARRDRELQDLLAASQAKTDGEIARVQAELRWRRPGLAQLRQRLVESIDAALRKDLTPSARASLAQLRAATLEQISAASTPQALAEPANVTADPLDGPRELREKADRLRDSGDKLRREANRIATRIDGVERRRHLRERAGSLDDDMFGEATSNRRVTRTTASLTTSSHSGGAGATTSQKTNAASDSNSPAAPAESPSPTPSTSGMSGPTTPGGTTTTPGGTTGFTAPPPARSSESTTLTSVIDPATLEELNRADGVDDGDRQARALRRVQAQLESRAKEYDKRAKELEERAKSLQSHK